MKLAIFATLLSTLALAADKPAEEKGIDGKPVPAAWNEKDATSSLRYTFYKAFPFPRGNELAAEMATKDRQKHWNSVVKNKLEWTLPVLAIRKDGTCMFALHGDAWPIMVFFENDGDATGFKINTTRDISKVERGEKVILKGIVTKADIIPGLEQGEVRFRIVVKGEVEIP